MNIDDAMTSRLQIATDLVEECLKDSPVSSAVRMRLAVEIAEKLHEQYKAGLLYPAVICQDTKIPPDVEEHSCLFLIECRRRT